MVKWYEKPGSEPDVVISSRIRLARNLSNYPFYGHMTEEQMNRLADDVKASLENINLGDNSLSFLSGDELTGYRGMSLVENHIVSPDFIQDGTGRMLVLSQDESISIMVNEEDHIRIQVMTSGLDLDSALEVASKIDDAIDASLNYAFDSQLGFLTACPSNLGTGLRASVMLHIPALEKAGSLNRLSGTLSKLGLTMRGTYGEGTKAVGSLYQISNQITLGISEEQAIKNLREIVSQIVEKEREAQKALVTSARFQDRIYRCFGTLKYAKMISTEEFFELISDFQIGISRGILTGSEFQRLSPERFNCLLFQIGSATLCQKEGRDLTAEERDELRAKIVQEALKE